jgi:hypothetical protein
MTQAVEHLLCKNEALRVSKKKILIYRVSNDTIGVERKAYSKSWEFP